MTKSSVQTPSETSSQAPSLSITFNGPMLFDFILSAAGNTVDIYVPYCPYHEAGFFFSSGSLSETDLWNCALQSQTTPLTISDRAYGVTGSGIKSNNSLPKPLQASFPTGPLLKTITPPESSTKQAQTTGSDTVYILKLPETKIGAKQSSLPPTLAKAMFKVSVPMPAHISPLYADSLNVISGAGTGPTPADQAIAHCTSVRFFYEWDAATDITLSAPGGGSHTITPPVYAGLPTMANIEIRYEGPNLADENDPHSDARSCFASLAALAGTDWWLNFNDAISCPTNQSLPVGNTPVQRDPCQATISNNVTRLQPRFHTGADCHAPIIVNGLDLS